MNNKNLSLVRYSLGCSSVKEADLCLKFGHPSLEVMPDSLVNDCTNFVKELKTRIRNARRASKYRNKINNREYYTFQDRKRDIACESSGSL